jgi:alpha-tubulin suppressor-like RCC1 family protein
MCTGKSKVIRAALCEMTKCPTMMESDCAPYSCSPDTNDCYDKCDTSAANPDAQCADGYRCSGGTCIFGLVAAGVGPHHACAVINDGKDQKGIVKCWGRNGPERALGTGVDSDSELLPKAAINMSAASSVAIGRAHSCAIVGGKVWCWGNDEIGQLGIGKSEAGPHDPALVPDLQQTSVTSITAGGDSSCAVFGGEANCWGDNNNSKLSAMVTTADSFNSPQLFYRTSLPYYGINTLGLGLSHGCLLSFGDGSVPTQTTPGLAVCWGSRCYGQVGDGSTLKFTDHPTTAQVEDNSTKPAKFNNHSSSQQAVLLAVGDNHACLSGTNTASPTMNAVYCWGENDNGQLGYATGTLATGDCALDSGSTMAAPVSYNGMFITGATSLAAGSHHSCAVIMNGQVVCWGDNSQGQLGNGDMSLPPGKPNAPQVVQVKDETGQSVLTGALQVYAGGDSTCAMTTDGRLLCWGANADGQLGVGDTMSRNLPTQVRF